MGIVLLNYLNNPLSCGPFQSTFHWLGAWGTEGLSLRPQFTSRGAGIPVETRVSRVHAWVFGIVTFTFSKPRREVPTWHRPSTKRVYLFFSGDRGQDFLFPLRVKWRHSSLLSFAQWPQIQSLNFSKCQTEMVTVGILTSQGAYDDQTLLRAICHCCLTFSMICQPSFTFLHPFSPIRSPHRTAQSTLS